MPELEIQSVRPSGRDLFHIICTPDSRVLASYQKAGQFFEVERGELRGYFAVASPPGRERLEFLVKDAGDLAHALCTSVAGERFVCSLAHGAGFPERDASRQNVHLFSMGSGIAPLRTLIQMHLAGAFPAQSLWLWQGAFDAGRLPFQNEYDEWSARGLNLRLCLDQPGQSATDGRKYFHGNVADALRAESPLVKDALCYWIGSKEFGAAIAAALTELGANADQILTNT
jgi:NAD(P)H-flavin reductase